MKPISAAEGRLPPLWRAMSGGAEVLGNGRVIRYRLSDSSVARDGHTIATAGWVVENYLRNPVFLWAHATSEPPIGRLVELDTMGDRLMGSVQYAEPDEYPFADTVYRLVKGGYLNATSVSWLPLEWKYSHDRSRPGGIDFQRVELLEVSQVPVPALPSALVDARAAGIDTGPLYEWAEKVLDCGDKMLIPRHEIEEMRRAAKMPKLRTPAAAVTDPPVPAPETDAEKTRAVERRSTIWEALKRELYNCGWLAQLLEGVAFLEEMIEWEEGIEGDDHSTSDRLVVVMRLMGSLLVDMTAAEVAKLLAEEDAEDQNPALRMLRSIGCAMTATTMTATITPAVQGAHVVQIGTDAARVFSEALERAGRVLSAENEATLRDVRDSMTRACDLVNSVIDRAAAPAASEIDELDDVETQRAAAKAALAAALASGPPIPAAA